MTTRAGAAVAAVAAANAANAAAAAASGRRVVKPAPAAPPAITLNDMMLQWINAANVTEHVQRAEREANALQQRLEDTLRRMHGGGDEHEEGETAAGATTTTTTEQQQQQQQQQEGVTSVNEGGDAASTSPAGSSVPPPLNTDSPTASGLGDAASPCSPSSLSLLSLPDSALCAGPSAPATRALALQARRAHVHALRHKLDALTQQRATVLARRQALQPKLALLQAAHGMQIAHREALDRASRKQVSELRLQLQLIHLRQSFRRRTLLHHLSIIYPLSPPRTALKVSQALHPLMCYTIRGLRLPNNFNNILTSFEEEQVSTALGYVCHLILMLAKYLDIPLRYRMIYRGSRSVICDDVTASSQFPLYFKNMEERRFELGVILLNKNVEHVSRARTRIAQDEKQAREHQSESFLSARFSLLLPRP